jgi:anti-sigma B factor antagonist
MKLDMVEEDNGVTRLILAGRLDMAGVTAVDPQVNAVAGSKSKVVVDLSGVDFMGSLGMRTLVVAAKTIAGNGGRMAILAPQPNVEKVLRTSGIDTVIPIAKDLGSAAALVR